MPQPKDPGIYNAEALKMELTFAFQDHDHAAHIMSLIHI